MNRKMIRVANKYAKAFFDVYKDTLEGESVFSAIKRTNLFLKKNPSATLYLGLQGGHEYEKLIIIFLDKFNLPSNFKSLLILLRKQKRIALLPQILHSMMDLCQEQSGAIFFAIESYPKIEQSELEVGINFLANTTNKKIWYSCEEKKCLIAGIKMQSEELLWEHSVQDKLRLIRSSLVG